MERENIMDFLKLVESGGCSAKLSASDLAEALKVLPKNNDKRLLVDIDTHDDAGVYQLTDDLALIQTTDFFPPVCSDPYDFGQVAAANALSDVYAMGGTPITAMNLVMFPGKDIPMEMLGQLLKGGSDKVAESGALIVGGHTITDDIPKYGLAVTGLVHPKKVITNANAKPNDKLILTKPLGTGVIVSAKKVDACSEELYGQALTTMKQLNKEGAQIMQDFGVESATDVTGFGLLGHALKMAQASDVTMKIYSEQVPVIKGVYDLVDAGCITCSMYRNQDYVAEHVNFNRDLDINLKMILLDAITSGGLLMAVKPEQVDDVLSSLQKAGFAESAVIGEVADKEGFSIIVK
jgi:selenide, water dikinase